MSRGHGRVQRQIIALTMEMRWSLTISDLCSVIYRAEGAPTVHQMLSVRRAIKRLADEKIIEPYGFNRRGEQGWKFAAIDLDRTNERQDMLRTRLRAARAPRLIKG